MVAVGGIASVALIGLVLLMVFSRGNQPHVANIPQPPSATASPLVTLPREGSVDALVGLVAEHEVVEVVVGLPRTLAGQHGAAAEIATEFAGQLAERLDVPVRLADERLTTVTATRVLAEAGVRGRRQRAVVDQAAAVEILQAWLDARAAALAREGRP